MGYVLRGRFLSRRLWRVKTFVAGFLIFSVCASSPALRRGAAAQSGCNVTCGATVPATGQIGASVSFTATASASGCASGPVYEWDFGDGTSIASGQSVTHTYASPGSYTWKLTTTAGAGATTINTIAGGYGENAPARQAPFTTLTAIARDPQGRGVYVIDELNGSLIRFINTSNAAATIAGRSVAPGAVRVIAGGGVSEPGEDTPALQAFIRAVGLVLSANGDLLFFNEDGAGRIRVINVSSNVVAVGGETLGVGNIRSFAEFFSPDPLATGYISGFAVHPTTGELYFTDSGPNVNKVFKISADGQTVTSVAGNGAATMSKDLLPAPPVNATNVPLLLPRDIVFDNVGNLYIADTGHGRVVKVDSSGRMTLARQFDIQTNPNPYPAGLAAIGGAVYVANGNQQTIVNVAGAVVSGKPDTACDYSVSSCGDGGAGSNAIFSLAGSTASPPLLGIESDGTGLYILDQGVNQRGRVRYLNLSGGAVTIAGTTIASNNVDTIAGSGLAAPFDGGAAISGALSFPVGVAIDANGNLFIADTPAGLLRFVNRGSNSATLFPNTPAQQVAGPGAIVTINKDLGVGPTDGVPVNQAGFDTPQGLFVTSQGVFVADSRGGPSPDQKRNGTIRFINTSPAMVTLYPNSPNPISIPPGNIAKIAGGSETAVGIGNGSFALDAKLLAPSDIVVNPDTGDIYIADTGNKAVRKVNGASGIISSLNLPASQYTGLGMDASGRLYIADFDQNRVLRESSPGSGQFAPLNSTPLNRPRDAAVDAGGAVYVTNSGDNRIVRISPAGVVENFAGTTAGFDGDGGSATSARLNISPRPIRYNIIPPLLEIPPTVNIVAGPGGEVIFTDSVNSRVRRISTAVVTCAQTGTITISGANPAPVLTSVNPSSATANSGAFTLTANGGAFTPSSVVRWNGQNRTTTFVSATQLTATIPASDLANPGTAQVTVFTPTPGGGTSGAVTFTITAPNPVPSITSLSPNSAVGGGPAFTLTVNGTGFVGASVVRLDGQDRATTFVNATRLTAQISATDIVGAGQASVTVFNPPPGGGVSNVATFTITQANSPVPTLTSISPNSITAGAAAFALIANGSNFVLSSKVRWNGQDLQTAFGGANQLTAQVPANLVANAGAAQVTVFTPAPGGGTSAARTFTISPLQSNPAPSVTALNPAVVAAGSAGFTLMVTGTNFISGTTARINGSNRATTVLSSTKLTATILAGDIAGAGDIQITAFNPAPGGGISNSVALKVAPKVTVGNAASFVTTQIAPDSIVAGFGTGMATGTQVASAVPLPTNLLGTTVKVTDSAGTTRDASLFFVSALQINFHVPPGTVDGLATVITSINNNIVGAGPMNITRVAPGLISANSDAAGVAAGFVVRVAGNGAQTLEPIARFDSGSGRFTPVPIDLRPAADSVFLILYGVGFRNAQDTDVNPNNGAAEKVTVTVDGVNIPVAYAGLAPGFVGLDQINAGPLPRSLIGRGVVNFVVTVDGKITNSLQLSFL